MDKKRNITEVRCGDFYFLYFEKESERGLSNRTWHMHSFYEIMFFADTESEYAIENNRYVVKSGDVLLIKPGQHHFERRIIQPHSAFFCLGFSDDALSSGTLAARIFAKREHIMLEAGHPISALLSAARDILEKSKSNAEILLKAIADAAILALNDPDLAKEDSAETNNSTISKIIDFINENLFEIKSIDDIARGVFFSNSYLRSTFKREMGIGVMQYVRNKKILIANDRIRKGERPTAIYAECGFRNYPSFYRAYCAYFGLSPKGKHNNTSQ